MMMKSIAIHQRMVSCFATTMIFTIHHFTKKVITSIAITTLITSIATTMITAITKMITSIATGTMMNTIVTTMMITNASMKLYTIGIMSSIMITDIMITMAITIKNTLSTSFCIKSCLNDFKFCTAFTMMKCFAK